MAKPVVGDAQDGFAGGYNSYAATTRVDPSQFAAMQNVRLVRGQELAKRPGLKLLSAAATGITGITYWNKAGTAPQFVLYGTVGGTARAFTGAFNSLTGAVVLTQIAVTSNRALSGAHFRDATGECLYLPSGVGSTTKLSKWDGTTYSDATIGLGLGLAYVWVYNQRLFGVTGTDQTLYWSALNNGDTIGDTTQGGGFATIRTYGGRNLLGGFSLGSTNFLMHDGAISVFRGRTFDDVAIDAGARGFGDNIGILRPRSWVVVDNIAYLTTSRGLFLLTEAGLQPYEQPGITDPIREAVQVSDTPVYTPVRNDRTNELWFFVALPDGSGGYHKYAYIYNRQLQRFAGQLYIPSNGPVTNGGVFAVCAGQAATGGGSQILLGAIEGVFGFDFVTPSLEVYQDNGSNFTSSVRCRRFFTERPATTKAWRRALVQMGAGALGTAVVGSDTSATASFTAADGTVSSDTTALLAAETTAVQIGGQGQYGDLTITDAGASGIGWSVNRADVEAFDYGARGR